MAKSAVAPIRVQRVYHLMKSIGIGINKTRKAKPIRRINSNSKLLELFIFWFLQTFEIVSPKGKHITKTTL